MTIMISMVAWLVLKRTTAVCWRMASSMNFIIYIEEIFAIMIIFLR